MDKLSLQDATFLKINSKYLPNIIKLRDGLIQPLKPSHKRFLNVLQGKSSPVTQWERAILHWTEMNEPDLVEYISNKIDENKKKNKVSENGINLKNSSNQKNKKLTQKQKQLEIEINHRKSGYYKQSLKFVSGGLPSLGKKK